MILGIGVLLLALAGNSIWLARVAARRHAYRRFWTNVIVGLALLFGTAVVTRYGLWNPTAFMPSPTSNCTWGLGAHVCVSPIKKSPLYMEEAHGGPASASGSK
jgi:hypothetical protein